MQLVCPHSYLWFRKVDGKIENMRTGALPPTEPALGHLRPGAGWPYAKHFISPSLKREPIGIYHLLVTFYVLGTVLIMSHAFIISFLPQNKPRRKVLLISSFYR